MSARSNFILSNQESVVLEISIQYDTERRGSLMVSVLDSGSGPGRGHCVACILEQDTLLPRYPFIHLGGEKHRRNAGGNPAMDLASHPGGSKKKYS